MQKLASNETSECGSAPYCSVAVITFGYRASKRCSLSQCLPENSITKNHLNFGGESTQLLSLDERDQVMNRGVHSTLARNVITSYRVR